MEKILNLESDKKIESIIENCLKIGEEKKFDETD